jgi:hypothetical protein
VAQGPGAQFRPRVPKVARLPAQLRRRGKLSFTEAGADYAFTRHLSLRAEYRGFVYKAPSFNLACLNTDTTRPPALPCGQRNIWLFMRE